MKKARLKNTEGMFHDSETGLIVVRDDVVPAPEPWGALTKEWVRYGGLIMEDDEPEVVVEPEPEPAGNKTDFVTTEPEPEPEPEEKPQPEPESKPKKKPGKK